jgi:hypothetical protein
MNIVDPVLDQQIHIVKLRQSNLENLVMSKSSKILAFVGLLQFHGLI